MLENYFNYVMNVNLRYVLVYDIMKIMYSYKWFYCNLQQNIRNLKRVRKIWKFGNYIVKKKLYILNFKLNDLKIFYFYFVFKFIYEVYFGFVIWIGFVFWN